MNSIFHRISVRKYEDRPVETEKIMEILKAGMQAPSACNQGVGVADDISHILKFRCCWLENAKFLQLLLEVG